MTIKLPCDCFVPIFHCMQVHLVLTRQRQLVSQGNSLCTRRACWYGRRSSPWWYRGLIPWLLLLQQCVLCGRLWRWTAAGRWAGISTSISHIPCYWQLTHTPRALKLAFNWCSKRQTNSLVQGTVLLWARTCVPVSTYTAVFSHCISVTVSPLCMPCLG